MSEENVEIARRVFAEFERGNFWLPEFFDASVHIRWLDAIGAESETRGLEDMSNFMKSWMEAFERLSLAAKRIVDAGEDRIVVVAAWRGKGKASGVDTEWRHGAVWTFRDGRVTSIIAHKEPRKAFEAAGLPE